jgi:hypothetical protein
MVFFSFLCFSLFAEHLASYPANLEILDQVEVEYETLPGWKKDVSGVRFALSPIMPLCLPSCPGSPTTRHDTTRHAFVQTRHEQVL